MALTDPPKYRWYHRWTVYAAIFCQAFRAFSATRRQFLDGYIRQGDDVVLNLKIRTRVGSDTHTHMWVDRAIEEVDDASEA